MVSDLRLLFLGTSRSPTNCRGIIDKNTHPNNILTGILSSMGLMDICATQLQRV